MLIAVIFVCFAALTIWRRPDIVSMSLIAFIGAGVFVGESFPRADMPMALALMEAIFAAWLALYIFSQYNRSDRCWCDRAKRSRGIALFSCIKIMLWLGYITGARMGEWNVSASANNGLLFCQILLAGGIGHEIVSRNIDTARGFIRGMFGRPVAGSVG